ncbi:MAG: sigma-54-dependent Fis family transcriptional regulator [Bacteroidales bacterium]|nr:sigma-54-dependent Fis family transcriptional regulator [Bacteroidales bacterium]MCK4638151.1 sigma-54-dependent Fis family transcriptional regulator [Bacteroidales bacterium]
MKKINILVLDDEKRVRDEIEEFLLGNNYKVSTAGLPSQAFDILKQNEIDIAILDIKLPEMNGLSVLKEIKKQYPEIEVIMISGHGDMNSVIDAMRLGASDFFQKPFRLIEVNNAIERTKKFITLNQKLKEAEQNYSLLSKELYENIGQRLLGNSSALNNVIDLMTKVAKTDTTSVLITGESGTGKELVARGIHYLSSRNKHYFHSVNCSAIPESLFESEFFGHKKGAFTGATEDKSGWFEIANKGTLFLDEVSDMPMNQQAKLLRVLEEKKIIRVGSHKSVDVDVRVIAASNQNLEKMSNERKFRFDLYHRLCSFIIHIPPLRERKEDIPLLLNYFIKNYSKKMAKPIKNIDKDILKELTGYSFPGNIRELKNMIERAMILCDDDNLSLKHFQIISKNNLAKNQNINATDEILDIELVEHKLITKALEKANNNKSKAAALLNISWQSLDRRMKKYGIN